jgi:hypothetical protein
MIIRLTAFKLFKRKEYLDHLNNYQHFTKAGFDVLTAMVMNSSIFWDITSCIPLKVNRRFEGICRLYLQGRRISQARNQGEVRWKAEPVNFQRTTRRYIPEDRTLPSKNTFYTVQLVCQLKEAFAKQVYAPGLVTSEGQ